MGLVPSAGQAKAFEGNPTNQSNLSDANSIQGAIKGTLDDPSQANSKNMLTLRQRARLDMFVPKRTTLPTSMADFRGFPRPTITVDLFSIQKDNGGITTSWRVRFNNKVGYPITFTVQYMFDNNVNTLTTENYTVNAGDTVRFMNFNDPTIYGSNPTPYAITLQSTSQSVYDSHLIGWSGNVATSVITTTHYVVRQNIMGIGVCYDPTDPLNPQTSDINHYFEGLAVGSRVWLNSNTSLPAQNGDYIQREGQFTYGINNGQISYFYNC